MTVRIGGSRFDQSAILNGMRLLAFDFAIRGNSDWMPRAHRQVRDQLGDRAGEWLAVFIGHLDDECFTQFCTFI
jgi:hypothetical protein